MAANIEFKARLRDVEAAHAVARKLSGGGPETLRQTDVFFRCPGGRLKLRNFQAADGSENHGELIFYQRADQPGPRRSNYEIARTSEPQALGWILQQVLGLVGVVNKVRSLYLVSQSRIHLDHVEELGDFMEIEVVLREGQTDAEGAQIAGGLMREFGIEQADLIHVAYMDLLRQQADASS